MFPSIYASIYTILLREGTPTIDTTVLHPKTTIRFTDCCSWGRRPRQENAALANLDTVVKPPRNSFARTRGPHHPPT